VAALTASLAREALAAQAVHVVAALQAHLLHARECRHVDPAIGHPGKAVHRHLAAQDAVVVEDEDLVRGQLHVQLDVIGLRGLKDIVVPHAGRDAHRVPVGARDPTGALAAVAHLPRHALAVTGAARRRRRDPAVPGGLSHHALALADATGAGEHAIDPPVAALAFVRRLAAQHLDAAKRRFFQREPDAPARGAP